MATKGLTSPHPASGTVLMAALVGADRLSYGSIGDAALVVCRPGAERGRQLNKEAKRFLGQPMNKRALKGTIQRGSAALDRADWVALVTDGLSEFVAPLKPADVVPRVLGTAAEDGARGAAVAIVEAACSAGAGDNVGAVVLSPQ
jgi:serine/threonine protein phosphatase PrpC